MPNILGLSACSGHDSAAALIKDGKLIAAVEEERLNRLKHYSDFPELSIRYCLREARLSPGDVDYIGIPWHPTAHALRRLGFRFFHNGLKGLIRIRRRSYFLAHLKNQALAYENMMRKSFPRAKVIYIEHHMAHAASAFFASPFKEAAILTMDGRGEWSTALLAQGEGNSIKKMQELFYPSSLGLLYATFTMYLGFELNDEYKVMGLAPYGSPKYIDIFRKAIRFSEKHIVDIDPELMRHPGYAPVAWGKDYYSDKIVSLFGPPRAPGSPIDQRHMDIASSLQARFNEIGLEIAQHLHSLTGKEYLCMAGGVALNGVMNYNIKSKGPFKDLFVQPASGDGGASLGSALYIQKIVCGDTKEFLFENAYWGPDYNNAKIKEELDNARLDYISLKDPAYLAAFLLKEGYIIGWFQGRAELGPRALGDRSILADPRKAEYKDIVNARIKFREEFRPFAPSVLREYTDDYFIGCNGPAADYMLLVAPVKEGKEKEIPAVTHVDGTGRVQAVDKKTNPLYHSLIKHFYDLTSVPVILNTSFNVKGEPIVTSPTDALRCFFSTGLDYLIMGDFLIFKRPLPDQIKRLIEKGRA